MTNNDILRRLRYILNFDDEKMVAVYQLAGQQISVNQMQNWLKKDEDAGFIAMPDEELALFLNGLIIENRGEKDGPQPAPEKQLNYNILLRKLKIAFNLKDFDILEIMKLADQEISKHELSAFFRKPGHKNFRFCNQQVFRKFLMGLQLKFSKS